MDKKVRELLDQMPERAPRSKLEPHAEVIRELRKKRRTYLEIAAFFREHLELPVAPSTLHDFVKTRARQARKRAAAEVALPENPPAPAPLSEPPAAETPQPNLSRPAEEIRERIRALKAKPVVSPPPARFRFDPDEPLTLEPKPKEK